jgi:hypothetical protein
MESHNPFRKIPWFQSPPTSDVSSMISGSPRYRKINLSRGCEANMSRHRSFDTWTLYASKGRHGVEVTHLTWMFDQPAREIATAEP